MPWEEVKRTAKNWVRWKAVVEALCSGRSEEEEEEGQLPNQRQVKVDWYELLCFESPTV